jgi:hypothetical protein
VTVTTEYLSFRDADPDSFARLNKVPTRLKLARGEVDLAIEAGRQAVRNNPNIQKVAMESRKGASTYDAIEARLAGR